MPQAPTALLALAVLAACDRPQPEPEVEPTVDSAVVQPVSPGTDTGVPIATGWEWDAGPFLILPTVDGGTSAGSLLRPGVTGQQLGDTSGIGAATGNGTVELFARSGLVGSARLSVEPGQPMDSSCAVWPVARLAVEPGAGAGAAAAGLPHAWTAAFPEGRVTAIPLDSIEGMSVRDSARLAANLTRLASALPENGGDSFTGLPFVVLRAYRSHEPGHEFVVATLIRRINQEDSPLEERLVMVVDAATADVRKWRVGWFERASGTEDELLVAEPLLAFRAKGSEEIRVLFGRDDGFSLSAAVLARNKSGWSLQWESPASGCDPRVTGTSS